ncbi:hypothetical protein POM88_010157 [Heracleum sosnowskyi]|uniref:Uncharacterized protein n=1 Tax=Heracleum sosnowskyi TaxID=360622 RepID=A0AAD8N871_9APIA|nr:hypothetical protein POM88_010157 [Heracleum sosnowskyi]
METYFANVTQTPSLIPTPNTTPNTSHTAPNTDPTPTAPTNDPMIIQDDNAPIEFKSPKKEADDEAHTLKKKPVRTSDIWDYFTKVAGENPQDPRAADKRQKVLSFHRTSDWGSNMLVATFNKVRCRNALAKFVVKDEQAFRVVEGEGFKEFINELQPKFVVPSRITVARDVYNLFTKERAKLKEELTAAGQREGRESGIKPKDFVDEIQSYGFIEEDNLDKGQASGATQDTCKMTINVVEE